MPEPLTSANFSENFVISKCSGSCTGCLVRYNFLDSQRPEAIGRAYEASHTGGCFDFKSFSNNVDGVKKIELKVRKRMDCTTTFRRAIAPADDITLRCNHSTNHVE